MHRKELTMAKTQAEYMELLNTLFNKHIANNVATLNSYSYSNHDAVNLIGKFRADVVSEGLKFSNCYHANGIGNNNEYNIYLEIRDEDGFVIQKNIAEFYYCTGIYGGCFVRLKDLSTGNTIQVGRAR